jgi:uncharacterized protein (DUF433 family)
VTDQELLQRVVLDLKVVVGKPVLRDTWLTVEHILRLLACGASDAKILGECEHLAKEDIPAYPLFAFRSLEKREPC